MSLLIKQIGSPTVSNLVWSVWSITSLDDDRSHLRLLLSTAQCRSLVKWVRGCGVKAKFHWDQFLVTSS